MKTLSLITAALALALVAAGCGDKNKKTKAQSAKPEVAADRPSDEEVRSGLPDPAEKITLATVYFDLDAATLGSEARANLERNAAALKDHAEVTIRIEGHADERGSTQYNLGLGERRANAVKEYLTTLGVGAVRLDVVSYGEERPAADGSTEDAWSRNRRVELAVTRGSDRVSSSYSEGPN